jgi:hypothetical protein
LASVHPQSLCLMAGSQRNCCKQVHHFALSIN